MYFSLGETIAVLGIVIAVYGIIRPKWRLNFFFNRRILYSVIILITLGLLSSFTAYVLAIYSADLKIYSNVLQGFAFAFFVFAMVDFVRGAFWSKPLYSHKNSEKQKERFVSRILDEALFDKDEDTMNAVITIVRNSLDEICKDIKFSKHNREEQNLATYLLDTLLSEDKVINHIVIKRLDFIHVLTLSLQDNFVRSIDIGNGVGRMIETLHLNQSSYLYQQIGYDGLSNYASIYSIIFENEYLIREFSLLSRWYGIGQRVSYKNDMLSESNYPKAFIKGFTLSLQKFGYTDDLIDGQLAKGMYSLSDYVEHVGRKVRTTPEYDYASPHSLAFHEVTMFIEHSFYHYVYSEKAKKGVISSTGLNPPLDSKKYDNEGLSAAFCRLFVDTIEAISSAFYKNDMERHEIISLNEIFVDTIGSYQYIEGLRTWILNELWKRSEDNIKSGHYPVVFRALVIMLYWQHNGMPNWAKVERNKMIDTLRKNLAPRILKSELMFDDETLKEEALLPSSIGFDKAKKQFYSIDRRGAKSPLYKQKIVKR